MSSLVVVAPVAFGEFECTEVAGVVIIVGVDSRELWVVFVDFAMDSGL